MERRFRSWGVAVLAVASLALVAVAPPTAGAFEHGSAAFAPERPAVTPDVPVQTVDFPITSTDIAKALATFAVEKLAGFVLNATALGPLLDPTGAKLDALKAQLDQIAQQVQTLQTSTNNVFHQVAQTKLDVRTVQLQDYVSRIQTLYTDFFSPAVAAAIKYAIAARLDPKCAPGSSCEKFRTYFEQRRTLFMNKYDLGSVDAASYNTLIHNALVPGPANSSAITAYGDFIMATNSFLTSAHSDQLRNFYSYFASYEALATWMKAEWKGVHDADNPDTDAGRADFDRFISSEVTGYQTSERNALPPVIPGGVTIVLQSDAALRTTTQNKQMWGWSPIIATPLRWNPDDPTGPKSVGAAIRDVNNARFGGYTDWAVPSQDDWKALFSGWKFNWTLAQFLKSMNPDWFTGLNNTLTWGPTAWSSNTANFKLTCAQNQPDENQGNGMVVDASTTLHTAINTRDNLLGWSGGLTPVLDRSRVDANGGLFEPIPDNFVTGRDYAGARAWCSDQLKAILAADVPANAAQLMLVRNTGNVNYMGTPRPGP